MTKMNTDSLGLWEEDAGYKWRGVHWASPQYAAVVLCERGGFKSKNWPLSIFELPYKLRYLSPAKPWLMVRTIPFKLNMHLNSSETLNKYTYIPRIVSQKQHQAKSSEAQRAKLVITPKYEAKCQSAQQGLLRAGGNSCMAPCFHVHLSQRRRAGKQKPCSSPTAYSLPGRPLCPPWSCMLPPPHTPPSHAWQ